MRAALIGLLISASAVFAQPEDDRFQVELKFDHGRFVTNRDTAKISPSARYTRLLRPGVTNEQLTAQFCDALDREFKIMPAPYLYTLKDEEQRQDRAGKLSTPAVATLREWNGTIPQFPALGSLNLSRNNTGVFGSSFNADVEKVLQRSGLAELVNQDDSVTRPFLFRLRDPLIVASLLTPVLGEMLDRDGVLKRLRPLDGLPANPEWIRAAIIDFYTPRGIMPTINLQLDASPPSLSIFETSRIARILLPRDLTEFSLAQRIVYESLPHRVFKAFRKKGQDELNRQDVVEGEKEEEKATKREIDLGALVADAEPEDGPVFQPPPVDANLLAQIQQRLLPLQHTASLFDFKPAELLFDLVLDPTTSQKGSGSETNAVSGTAETPPNAPAATQRQGANVDLQPSPVAPAAAPNPKRSGNTPQEEQRHFIGGGFEYRPGQGSRALGSYQVRNTWGTDLFGIEMGGTGSGFGTGHYSRDYLFFDALGRRLTVDVNGGSDYEQERLLADVPTNERRTGGAFRVDLQAFRDWAGHDLSVFLEGRHESVRLTAAQPETAAGPELRTNLDTIDAGLAHNWRRALTRHPTSLRIEPSIRFGLGLNQTEPTFGKVRIAMQYHQSIAGPIEVESRFQARYATAATPVFELPSLGGADSVRGFRSDERLGRRLWAWQNELWFPVLGGGPPSKVRDFIRRNLRLATLYDLGGLSDLFQGAPASPESFRHGAGLGLRVKYQGVVIESDWAYGFGSDETSRPGRGRFYFNFRLP